MPNLIAALTTLLLVASIVGAPALAQTQPPALGGRASTVTASTAAPRPTDPYRPVEAVRQTWAEGVWTNASRYVYDYPEDSTNAVYQTWDGEAWADVSFETSVYDEAGRQTEYVVSAREEDRWAFESRVLFVYDEAGHRTQMVSQAPTEAGWTDTWRDTFAYDEAGRETERASQRPDGGGWVNYTRRVTTYDGAGAVATVVEEGWYDGAWVTYTREVSSYAAGRLAGVLAQRLDAPGGWTDTNRIAYTYDGAGNVVEAVYQERDPDRWVNYHRETFVFDASDRMAVVTVLRWDRPTEAWVAMADESFAYDTFGNPTERVERWWDGGAWVDAARTTTTYERATSDERGVGVRSDLTVAPNPSAGRATVSFGVPEPQAVRVAVYDALGREVVVLADAPFVAGQHTVPFDRALPAGVYVVRIAGETLTGSRVVTVVR